MTGVGEGEQPDQNLLHNDPIGLLIAYVFRIT